MRWSLLVLWAAYLSLYLYLYLVSLWILILRVKLHTSTVGFYGYQHTFKFNSGPFTNVTKLVSRSCERNIILGRWYLLLLRNKMRIWGVEADVWTEMRWLWFEMRMSLCPVRCCLVLWRRGRARAMTPCAISRYVCRGPEVTLWILRSGDPSG